MAGFSLERFGNRLECTSDLLESVFGLLVDDFEILEVPKAFVILFVGSTAFGFFPGFFFALGAFSIGSSEPNVNFDCLELITTRT
jgi:hypothetical protein